MVNNVLPNQIAGRFFPIFDTMNPAMAVKVEATKVYGSILDIKCEAAGKTSVRKRYLTPAPVAEEPSTEGLSISSSLHDITRKHDLGKTGEDNYNPS